METKLGHQYHRRDGYDFSKSLIGGKRFNFGPRDSSTIAVDLSLANLFQKLTVECSGILANPQWKHWSHMEMLKKDEIRLSNGIWRSWHLQFQKNKRPLFCSFVLDPDADARVHKEPQSIVIEGKYWKRSTQAVANEYRKWRLHYYQKKKQVITKSTDGSNQLMQVDTAGPSNTFPMTEDVMFPRPGDERSYMRPLLASAADVMQQPSLEMLNPSLEELLDRLEPMEVMFPSFTLGVTPNPRPSNDVYYPQYGNQPSYNASSTKPIGIPSASREAPGYGNYNQDYGINPAGYINPLGRGETMMDIGTPPGGRGMPIKEGAIPSKLNKPPPLQTQYPEQAAPTNPGYSQMMGGATALGPPPIHSYMGQMSDEGSIYMPPSADHTPTVPPVDPSHYPFTIPPTQQTSPLYNNAFPPLPQKIPNDEVSPTHALGSCRDNVQSDMVVGEPSNEFITHHIKKMEAEQLRQMREIDKQQELATQQYLHLVHRYVTQSGEQPSVHQQQILTSALSDPTMVAILKYVLLQGGEETTPPSTTPVHQPPSIGIKQESPNQDGSILSFPKVVTPKHIAKAAGVSDFQSRIVMAAAAQVNTPTGNASVSPFSSRPETPHKVEPSPATPNIKSPCNTNETDNISHVLMKKFKNARNLSAEEKRIYQELRRQTHISAEQKRRGSIKYGFDQLQSFVINPSQHPSGKVSKAVILEKTLEHIHQQHSERNMRERKMHQLKEELQQLNEAIVNCQQQLPASGAPVTRQRFEENRQKFKEFVQSRTQQNYKFWIYSIILQQLFETYNSSVSTGSVEELCQTVLTWFEQNCSLPSLRPVVMNSLKELSMKTSILSDPSKVPQQLSSYDLTQNDPQ